MPFAKGKSSKGKGKNARMPLMILVAVVAVVALAGVGLAYQGGYFHLSSITPGFEGLQFYLYGFSPANLQNATPTGTQLPSPFTWQSSGAYSAIVSETGTGLLPSNGKLDISLSYTSTDTNDVIQEVNYYVLQSTQGNISTYEHVVGYLVPAYFDLNIYSVPGSGMYDFQGQQIWLVGQTEVWDHAMIDPTNPNTTFEAAYSVPIAAAVNTNGYVINGYHDASGAFYTSMPQWVLNHCQLNPQNGGQPLTLYTDATTAGANPAQLYNNPSELYQDAMNSTLAGNPTPDSGFSSQVFTPITLVNFGGSSSGTFPLLLQQQGYPSVTYNIVVYYLELGTFLLQVNNTINSTLPVFQSQNTTVTTSPWQNFENSLGSWWSNPLNQLELFLVIIIAAIAVVVIFLVFTNVGRAADKAVGQYLSNRNKGGKK
jgi:hypothetical protein